MQIQKKDRQIFARILREINLKYEITGFCEIEKYYGVVWFDGKSKYRKKNYELSHFQLTLTQKQLRKRKLNMKFFYALPPSSDRFRSHIN